MIGSIRPPGSKSLTNRALVVAALAEGTSTLTDVLDSDDTAVMMESLRRLGIEVHLYNPSSDVREVLEITRLDQLFKIHELVL